MVGRMTSHRPPRYWIPIALWVVWGKIFGQGGHFLCPDCNNDKTCFGCPAAYRVIDGNTEYYREPKHSFSQA